MLGWKFEKREVLYVAASCAVFALLAFGWFGYWFITDPHYRMLWDGWRESMREESARHPVVLANLRPYLLYFFISAPLVFLTLPFAPIREWRAPAFVADAFAMAGGVLREPDLVLQLQHDDQLALLPNWFAGTGAAKRGVVAASRREETRKHATSVSAFVRL